MRYDIRYLPLSASDLDSIASYLSQFYPGTLSRFFEKLSHQIDSLKVFPELYQAYEDSHYRCMPVSDYLVFYNVNTTDKTVNIHRILRGSWNNDNIINSDLEIVDHTQHK